MKARIMLVITTAITVVVAIGIAKSFWAGTTVELPDEISLPDGWVLKADHTKDSSRGTITRQSDILEIVYDIS